METTVSGLFVNAAAAQAAMHALGEAGFGAEAIEVITSETKDRHTLIGEETADLARGCWLGAGVGGVGMAGGGLAMVSVLHLFSMHPLAGALLFGAAGAAAGAIVGLLVGSATGHQVQEEYEHRIEHGAVLLAVNTSGRRVADARAVLARCDGSMLSTSVHRPHHGHAQQSA